MLTADACTRRKHEHKLQTLPAACTTYNLLSLCAFNHTVEFTDTGSSYTVHRKSQRCWCCTMLYTTSTVYDCSRWCFSRMVDFSSHPRSFSSFLHFITRINTMNIICLILCCCYVIVCTCYSVMVLQLFVSITRHCEMESAFTPFHVYMEYTYW